VSAAVRRRFQHFVISAGPAAPSLPFICLPPRPELDSCATRAGKGPRARSGCLLTREGPAGAGLFLRQRSRPSEKLRATNRRQGPIPRRFPVELRPKSLVQGASEEVLSPGPVDDTSGLNDILDRNLAVGLVFASRAFTPRAGNGVLPGLLTAGVGHL
jgi:hypothetical protein